MSSLSLNDAVTTEDSSCQRRKVLVLCTGAIQMPDSSKGLSWVRTPACRAQGHRYQTYAPSELEWLLCIAQDPNLLSMECFLLRPSIDGPNPATHSRASDVHCSLPRSTPNWQLVQKP